MRLKSHLWNALQSKTQTIPQECTQSYSHVSRECQLCQHSSFLVATLRCRTQTNFLKTANTKLSINNEKFLELLAQSAFLCHTQCRMFRDSLYYIVIVGERGSERTWLVSLRALALQSNVSERLTRLIASGKPSQWHFVILNAKREESHNARMTRCFASLNMTKGFSTESLPKDCVLGHSSKLIQVSSLNHCIP